MKRLATLTAAMVVATAVLGTENTATKHSCCCDCKESTRTKETKCVEHGSCKESSACPTACESAKKAEKSECSGGVCPLTK